MSKRVKIPRSFAAQFIVQMNLDGQLDLTPDYQRQAVWKASQKQLLVDTMLRGFDIPKLYFRTVSRPPVEFEVVDGQQRIRCITEYFEGHFNIASDADDIDGVPIRGMSYAKLPTSLKSRLNATQLDVVELLYYSDDDVREMFERLQNGTPLNAPEKRHARTGGVSDVVRYLAAHDAFKSIAGFANTRYAFEDVSARVLHEFLAGKIVDIRPGTINKTYDDNERLTIGDSRVAKVVKVLNFLNRALKGRTMKLKKGAFLSLSLVVGDLIDQFNLSNFTADVGTWYEQFELARAVNDEREEADPAFDQQLYSYTDNLRNDSVAALNYRDLVLKERLFTAIPGLTALHPTRAFNREQRAAILVRDGGKCRTCQVPLTLELMHADHVVPHSAGGPTTVQNGQALCVPCNLAKGASPGD